MTADKTANRAEHIHFVTGRLAEFSLRAMLDKLAPQVGFDYSIQVLNITVAALMTPAWVAKRIEIPSQATRVLLPGYCEGDLTPVTSVTEVPVECGPKDLRRLPRFFGQSAEQAGYGPYEIEILAEINGAPRLALQEILAEARRLTAAGADLIDLGCLPGEVWSGVGEATRALRDAGYRVSVDSMNVREIELATRQGAELVLSVNSSNREAALDWGCEVVVVPDVPKTLAELDATVEMLAAAGVPLRIDPILEPIGFGYAESLARYVEIRRRYPDAEMMMGTGNLTELTDCDSAAVNVLLMGFCAEMRIHSVLTTEVINWARSSVAECDLARRLADYAVRTESLPKRIEPRLVMLRDPELLTIDVEAIRELSTRIKDNNYRIFAADGQLHLISNQLHLTDADPFRLFDQLLDAGRRNLDPSHAFYLGYELHKAATALTLGKNYEQDESLDWGLLTQPEAKHRLSPRGKDQ